MSRPTVWNIDGELVLLVDDGVGRRVVDGDGGIFWSEHTSRFDTEGGEEVEDIIALVVAGRVPESTIDICLGRGNL